MFCRQPTAFIVALAIGWAIVPAHSQGEGCPSGLSASVTTNMCATTTTTATTMTTTTTTMTSSTTTVTTFTTTSTTLTTSTTTVTTFTTTSTTMSTTTSTMTSITSSTSTVTTFTTTTATVTTTYSCSLCKNLPLPTSQENLAMSANQELTLTAQTSDCLEVVSTAALTVKCENGNQIFPTVKTGAYPRIKCHVCSVTYSTDTQAGNRYSGTVSWGPNVKSSSVDETSIKEYKLYLASQGLRLRLLATVTKSSTASTCCEPTKYQSYVENVELTGGGSTYNFMVVPVDTGSPNVELKFGRMSAVIVTDNGTLVGTASGAQRRSAGFAMVGPFASAMLATAFAVTALF